MNWIKLAVNENYSINENGEVKNNKTNKLLKQSQHKNGYMSVSIKITNGSYKQYYVHRLVAETFLPNLDNLTDVNHKDYNKQNNSVENLEWCSRSDNLKHSYNYENRNKNRKHAKELATKNHEKMKIKVTQRTLSGEFVAEYNSMREAEEKTGHNAYTTSMEIYTTLDTNIQDYVNGIMYGESYDWENDVAQAGIAILNVKDGSVAALGGNRKNDRIDAYNYATDMNKQMQYSYTMEYYSPTKRNEHDS